MRLHVTETVSVCYALSMNTDAKIIARFMVALLETSTPAEALEVTEDAFVADLTALGSTTPEHGIRAVVRRTVTASLAAL